MTISIRSVAKAFGRYPALKDVSVDIAPGELLALLGPSGSGKTTLLRTIAGLEKPDAGQVLFDGEDMTHASAAGRRVGFVFQQYALFKHMTVAKNVAFGLDVRGGADRPPKAGIAARVEQLLKLVELDGLSDRYPAQLSGGQRQRVALARALAVAPRVLLLDEPFGALDATVRKSLRRELRRIHGATGVTTLFVTHDQDEALGLADRVAVLNGGVIEQVGTPEDLQDHPANAFVCSFVGESNRLEGVVRGGRFTVDDVTLPAPGAVDGPSVAFVRPHDLALDDEGFRAVVRRIGIDGAVARIAIETARGQRLEVRAPREQGRALSIGAGVGLTARVAHVFPA